MRREFLIKGITHIKSEWEKNGMPTQIIITFTFTYTHNYTSTITGTRKKKKKKKWTFNVKTVVFEGWVDGSDMEYGIECTQKI